MAWCGQVHKPRLRCTPCAIASSRLCLTCPFGLMHPSNPCVKSLLVFYERARLRDTALRDGGGGVDLEAMRVADVEVIDLHPQLLEDRWSAYAGFVLHHEYIHALGFRGHDSTFRSLESAWPGRTASRHAPEFTETLRRARAAWLWVCSQCDRSYPRQKQSKGRYRCRACSTVLTDCVNPDKA